MSEVSHLKIAAEDRFHRLRQIAWWDQACLGQARVLVIGAGALGNEILKNLALLGIGQVFIADLDRVEESNLSRSVLYREGDRGRPKAEVAAQAIKEIYPQVKAQYFHGDVIYELGMGVYAWADVVIAGLDNREARLHVNRSCWKTNTPWIDGATEVLRGVVRVFVPPAGSCFECTMTEADWQVLQERRGCAGLRALPLPEGATPTTPITASIIAAWQCQEAIKLLHGLDSLAGKGLVFNGESNDTYVVPYPLLEDCNSHETFTEIVPLAASVHDLTLGELLAHVKSRLGATAALDLPHEILLSFRCPACQTVAEVFRPLGSVSESQAACLECGRERQVETVTSIQGSEAFLDRTLAQMGLPPFEIITGRHEFSCIGFTLSGDAPAVLGALLPSTSH